jgi:hypothetical protein
MVFRAVGARGFLLWTSHDGSSTARRIAEGRDILPGRPDHGSAERLGPPLLLVSRLVLAARISSSWYFPRRVHIQPSSSGKT